MSLLTWERPRLRRRGDICGAANARPAAGPALPALTPLRMTLVGALLIAVGPLSMSLYTPAMTLLIAALHTSEARDPRDDHGLPVRLCRRAADLRAAIGPASGGGRFCSSASSFM